MLLNSLYKSWESKTDLWKSTAQSSDSMNIYRVCIMSRLYTSSEQSVGRSQSLQSGRQTDRLLNI